MDVVRVAPEPKQAAARVYWLDKPQRDPAPDLEAAWAAATGTPKRPENCQPLPPGPFCFRCGRMRALLGFGCGGRGGGVAGACRTGNPLAAGCGLFTDGKCSERCLSAAIARGDESRSVLPAIVSDPDAFVCGETPAWNRMLQQHSLVASSVSALRRQSPGGMGCARPGYWTTTVSAVSRAHAHRTAPPWALRNNRIGSIRLPIRSIRSHNLAVTSGQREPLGDAISPPKSAGFLENSEKSLASLHITTDRAGDGAGVRFSRLETRPFSSLERPMLLVESTVMERGNVNKQTSASTGTADCKGNGSGDAKHVTVSADVSHKLQKEGIKTIDSNYSRQLENCIDEKVDTEKEEIVKEVTIAKSDKNTDKNCIEELFDECENAVNSCNIDKCHIENLLERLEKGNNVNRNAIICDIEKLFEIFEKRVKVNEADKFNIEKLLEKCEQNKGNKNTKVCRIEKQLEMFEKDNNFDKKYNVHESEKLDQSSSEDNICTIEKLLQNEEKSMIRNFGGYLIDKLAKREQNKTQIDKENTLEKQGRIAVCSSLTESSDTVLKVKDGEELKEDAKNPFRCSTKHGRPQNKESTECEVKQEEPERRRANDEHEARDPTRTATRDPPRERRRGYERVCCKRGMITDTSTDSSSSTSCCSSIVFSSCASLTATTSGTSSCCMSPPSWLSPEDDNGMAYFWGYWAGEGGPRCTGPERRLDCEGGDDGSIQGSLALQGDSLSDEAATQSHTAVAVYSPAIAIGPDANAGCAPTSPSSFALNEVGTEGVTALEHPATPVTPVTPATPATPATPSSALPSPPATPSASSSTRSASVHNSEMCITNEDGLHGNVSSLSFASSNIVPPTPAPSLASIDASDPRAAVTQRTAEIRNPCVRLRGAVRRRQCLHISIPGVSPAGTEPAVPTPPATPPSELQASGSAVRRATGRGKPSQTNSGLAFKGERATWTRRRGGGAGAGPGRGCGSSSAPRARGPVSRAPGAVAGPRMSAGGGVVAVPAWGCAGGAPVPRRTPRPAFNRVTWSHRVRPEEAAAAAALMS